MNQERRDLEIRRGSLAIMLLIVFIFGASMKSGLSPSGIYRDSIGVESNATCTVEETSAIPTSFSLAQNYTDHEKIFIGSDADFAAQRVAENWTGDGTTGNPYIIEGYNITYRGYNIRIENVTSHFVIRDCLLVSPVSLVQTDPYDNGISIYNSSNGRIYSNIILPCWDAGIYAGLANVQIVGNQLSAFHPHVFDARAHRGIILSNSSGIILYNELSSFWEDGIYILESRNVNIEYNQIMDGAGIAIDRWYQVPVRFHLSSR